MDEKQVEEALGLATRDQLLAELRKRSKAMIFAATYDHEGIEAYQTFNSGGVVTCRGLAAVVTTDMIGLCKQSESLPTE